MRKQIRGKDEIEQMKSAYESGKSLSEVGSEFGISPSRVEQIFRRNNIKTRRVTVSEKFLKGMDERRIMLDKAVLFELYIEEKLSIQKIADRLRSTAHVVRRNLQTYKIPIRPREQFTRSRLTDELLRRLYLEENLTAAMIARRLGYAPETIGKKLSLMGIKKRRSAECSPHEASSSAAADADASPPESPAGYLTVEEMKAEYNLHKTTIRKMLRQNRFPNAYREGRGQCARWLIPMADLKDFSPRRKGALRPVGAPKVVTLRSRGKYARLRIKRLRGHGADEIKEMLRLENEGVSREGIAVRFRIEERLVADILDELASRRPQRRKSTPIIRDWRLIPGSLLQNLYVEGRFSISYIIDKLATNETTLYIALKQFGLPLRNEDFQLSARENQDIFRQLLISEKLAPTAVAARLNLTIEYIKQKLKKLNASA